MKKISLKSLFKPSRRTNQWYLNYKGTHIYIDNEDFKKASEEYIKNIINAYTKNAQKPNPQKDIVPYEDGLELFKQGKERLKARMTEESFFEFYYSRK